MKILINGMILGFKPSDGRFENSTSLGAVDIYDVDTQQTIHANCEFALDPNALDRTLHSYVVDAVMGKGKSGLWVRFTNIATADGRKSAA